MLRLSRILLLSGVAAAMLSAGAGCTPERNFGAPSSSETGGQGGESGTGGAASGTGAAAGETGSGGGEQTCPITLSHPAPALFFVAERSEEMNTTFGTTKEAVAQAGAIEGFVNDVDNAGLLFAATVWPAKSGDVCLAETYAPDVATVAALPEAGTDVVTLLKEDLPSGDPSSAGALAAAHAAAASYQAAHPEVGAEVVLFIGNLGGFCAENTVEEVALLLAAARDQGIRTWIIPGLSLSPADLATLVEAGGAKTLSTSRTSALNQLPDQVVACRYLLDGAKAPSVAGKALTSVADLADCTSDGTDEYFVDATGRLVLCPSTCSSVGLQKVSALGACAE
jgi:hypothetical protein